MKAQVKRIFYGVGLVVGDSEEARQLLRTKHLPSLAWPMEEDLVEILVTAYPEASTMDAHGESVPDWKALALAVARDFVPAFQPGEAQGRPPAVKDGLVSAVDDLMASGEAKSIVHACNMLGHRGEFPDIGDIRKAYYRRKKLSQ